MTRNIFYCYNKCSMSEQTFLKEENLLIYKEIELKPSVTQRYLSSKLGISLGKINYLVKELIKMGFIEIKNFSIRKGKAGKIHYLLTKEGLEHKMQLTEHFLKEKEAEYYRLKQEWEQVTANTKV